MSPFTVIVKQITSLGVLILAGLNPHKVEYILRLGDIQDELMEEARLDGRSENPDKDPRLHELWQQKYHPEVYDLKALEKLPSNTLGHKYAVHMQEHGLKPDYFEDKKPKSFLHFLRLRVRQVHDIYHTLLGLGTDQISEIAVQGFSFAQFPNSQSAMLFGGSILRSTIKSQYFDMKNYIEAFFNGYSAGKTSTNILAVKWEELWEHDIDDIRRIYNLRSIYSPKSIVKQTTTQNSRVVTN